MYICFMRHDENTLLNQIREGDREGFRLLFDLYYKRLYLYSSHYLEDPNTAEDLVQEVFLYIWKNRSRIRISSSLSGYLFASIHHRCIEYLRKARLMESYRKDLEMKLKEAQIMLCHATDFSFDELDLAEVQSLIDRVITGLPTRTQEVFLLSRQEGLSHVEIADKLGVSVKAVEYHITNALKSLRSALVPR